MTDEGKGRQPDNHACFLCGDDYPSPLKVRPQVDRENGRARCEVAMPGAFQGWEGMAHGGIIAALLDEVSAYAAMTVAEPVVTAELDIRYRRPVPIDQELTASAEVRKREGRSVRVTAELRRGEELLASADARLVIIKSGTRDAGRGTRQS